MSYHRPGLPPEFVPPPIVEPLTSERFMELLANYVRFAKTAHWAAAHDELKVAVDELFRRLAT